MNSIDEFSFIYNHMTTTTLHKILLSDIFDEKDIRWKKYHFNIVLNKGLTAGMARKFKITHLVNSKQFDKYQDNEIVSFSHINYPDPIAKYYINIQYNSLLMENKNLSESVINEILIKFISTDETAITGLLKNLTNVRKIPIDYLLILYKHIIKSKNYDQISKCNINISIPWDVCLEGLKIKTDKEILDMERSIQFVGIISYNAPINIINYLTLHKFRWNKYLLSLNKNITDDFVSNHTTKIDTNLVQSNTSISLKLIHECKIRFNKYYIYQRLHLTIEELYTYGLLERSLHTSLLFKNPSITINIIKEHNLFDILKASIYQNPSITYEDAKYLYSLKSDVNSVKEMMNGYVDNDFEFSSKMIQLNEILEKSNQHISQLSKLLEQYLTMVLCKVIIDYEFYR
jgi:hypothetical protein